MATPETTGRNLVKASAVRGRRSVPKTLSEQEADFTAEGAPAPPTPTPPAIATPSPTRQQAKPKRET